MWRLGIGELLYWDIPHYLGIPLIIGVVALIYIGYKYFDNIVTWIFDND